MTRAARTVVRKSPVLPVLVNTHRTRVTVVRNVAITKRVTMA